MRLRRRHAIDKPRVGPPQLGDGRGPQLAQAPGVLGPRSAAYDLGYGVPDTPFVRWARAQGVARAEQGFGMLIEQAAESFRIWRGVRPDTAPLHREAAAR